ncbi:hypothetical protein V1477_006534 [Vespula maculifrons]|uniref:Uncharacterized protein n=1 Tax=Vespula maculifrons TaxID=7453 RepID=A0ABD2CJ57_VESMC
MTLLICLSFSALSNMQDIFWNLTEISSHSPDSTCITQYFDILQVPSTQVSPRGGCCIWRPKS